MENTDLKHLWEQVLVKMEAEIGFDANDLWIKPLKPLVLNGSNITIEVPNQVWYHTVRDKYEEKLLSSLNAISGTIFSIEYTVPMGSASPQPAPVIKIAPKPVSHADFQNRLIPAYTFEEFIEGPSNRFAYKAAQAVVTKLGDRTNNPMVIFSKPGLGKTHLLHSIGNEILRKNPKAKVLYLSGEDFVNEYIESLQKKTSESFRNKYRNLDCFLVDDIQFVAGKERSEQEFFYTFNTLFESRKQIVLTSDKTPKELSLDERLSSRLLSGIATEIKPPDIETRIAILRKKREKENLNISDDVIVFLGTSITSSIRELIGSLNRLDWYCSINKTSPTIDIAKEILADVIPSQEKNTIVNAEQIKKIIAEHFNLSIDDIVSPKKTHSISWPRQIAMYLCHEMTSLSLPEIGQIFERDHTTVMHARDKVKKEIESNPFFSAEINQIIADVKAVDKP